MSWIAAIMAKLRPARKPAQRTAAFHAANLGRLTSSWTTDPGAINRWLRYELRTLRARSRELARGDAYGAKYIKSCWQNIAGPDPFRLQAKIKKQRGKFVGQLDGAENRAIEQAWEVHGRAGNFESTGKLSRAEFHRLAIRTMARDGEALILIERGRRAGPHGIQFRLIDIDRLDTERNETLANGRVIKMGVELDDAGRVLAYHVLKNHPGESGTFGSGATREYMRVLAQDAIHLFIPEWPEQVRGIPWMHAAMIRLWNLGGFEEAAVVNARVTASKIAVLQSNNAGDSPINVATGQDSVGNLLTDSEPGQYWTLPDGYTLNNWSPQFPDAAVEPFVRACLRGAAAAVGMAHHSFANDAANVNYSTGRIALLEERDMWMSIQNWYIEHVCMRMYDEWREAGVMVGAFPQSWRDDAHAMVRWQPKTWGWIDPLKDMQGNVTALDAKLTSRTRIASEQGADYEDILDEIASENQMAEEKGVELQSMEPAPPSAPTPPTDDDEEVDDAASTNGRALRAIG